MKPDATLKPGLTLEHVLAAAVAGRLTEGTVAMGEHRDLAYQAALEGFQIGIATAAQFIAEMAVNEDNELLREAERQVRALPGDLA